MSTVTVVATAEPANNPPRVRLDVTDTGSSPALFATTVTRLDPDGNTRTVRTADGAPLVLTTSGANRVGLLYDYEMPYAPVTYSTFETPANTATATVSEDQIWLIHPGVPARSQVVAVAEIEERTRRVQRGIHYPMGRSAPVVQTDGQRKASEYTLTLNTYTDAERSALIALLDDASILLLNVPADQGWGMGSEYVSVGDAVEARLVDYAAEPRRYWHLPLTVVDAPVGGSQSERAYTDLLDFSSYTELSGAYATYSALLAGP